MQYEQFLSLAIALGLGLLVGLQREWKKSEIAGIRTFPLITLLGTLAAMLDSSLASWITPAGFLAVAGLLAVVFLNKCNCEDFDPGLTTEMAVLVMYGVGAMLGAGFREEPIALGGLCAVLLHFKQELHGLVRGIGAGDLKAIMQLALISLVALPVLPNHNYGPYQVWNPYRIWLMVVLIVGISLAGYLAYRMFQRKLGSLLAGVLGGLISSTATTVSYARQSCANASLAPLAALVILIASAIANLRVLLEIGVVAPAMLAHVAIPVLAITLLMATCSLLLYLVAGRNGASLPEHDNPAHLAAAIVFAAVYAVILLLVAAAKAHFGTGALYGVALISGLTDMDAITLSTAELFQRGELAGTAAWRVIVLALMANLAFKGGAVMLLGSPRLRLYMLTLFGLVLITSGLLLAYLPEWQLPAEWFYWNWAG